MNTFKQFSESEDEDYRGNHQPSHEDGAPLHDLTVVYPDDVYGSDAVRNYGDRSPYDNRTFGIVFSAKGKPNQSVNIYRAVPNVDNVELKINEGDWVTINRGYAETHGDSALKGNYTILTKTVPARTLFTSGDSIHEWGYFP